MDGLKVENGTSGGMSVAGHNKSMFSTSAFTTTTKDGRNGAQGHLSTSLAATGS